MNDDQQPTTPAAPQPLPPLPGGGSWRWINDAWVPAYPDDVARVEPAPQLSKE